MRQQVAFLGNSFGTGVFSAFNNFTLTLWLAAYTDSYLLLGLLGNSRAFVGAIVSPLAGRWSDRVWLGWLGRRRPFILGGVLLAGLGMALTPAVAALPLGIDVGWLSHDLTLLGPAVLVVLLYTAWYNAADDIHQALLVDITTEEGRNRLAARSVVTHFVGQVAILVLGFGVWHEAVPSWAFGFTAALMVAGALMTVLGVRERRAAPSPNPPLPAAGSALTPQPFGHPSGESTGLPTCGPMGPLDPHGPLPAAGEGEKELPSPLEGEGLGVRGIPGQGVRASPGRWAAWPYRGAVLFGLVYFCYWSGVNAVMPLVSIYTQHILGATVGEAQLLPALLLLSTAVMAIPMGWLGDRYGRKHVLTAGYAIMGLCGLAGLAITTKEQGAVVFLLAGVGNAASMVLTIPFLAELIPTSRIGTATGLLAATGSVAAPLASLVAGSLSDLYGPRAIFGLMGAAIVLALALLPAIHRPAPEILTTDAQPDTLQPARHHNTHQ